MAKTRKQKEAVVEKVRDIFNDAKNVVFANFHGLSVEETNKMRQEFRDKEIGYFVAKKTLTKRALQDLPIGGNVPELEGELAIAWGQDETGAARGIREFEKEYDGRVTILGGVFEERYLDKIEMTEIADIPSLDVLRGMFANVINSPIQGFAVALNAIAEKKA